MPSYRIVCIKRVTVEQPVPHPHLLGVGTGESEFWADMRWEVAQVYEAMSEGDDFYFLSPDGDRPIPVETVACPVCGQDQLRLVPSMSPDLALIDQRECKYAQEETPYT